MYKLESVLESEKRRNHWDFEIQRGNLVSARRADLVIIDKKRRSCCIVGFASQVDHWVKLKKGKRETSTWIFWYIPAPRYKQSLRAQSTLLFTHGWTGNYGIHTFLKGISAMWNITSPRNWSRVTPSSFYDGNLSKINALVIVNIFCN